MSENISQKQVADFYDDFAKKQVKTGLNLRHYKSYKFIRKFGLKKHHHVLEIGCGIGTFTKLLLRNLSQGSLVGTDISPTNIQEAKNTLGKYKNADFIVSDMIDYTTDKKFDFIIMLDVLEHIPVEQHDNLFKTFSKVLKDDGTVYINIPHHIYLDYVRENQPERLQIIDQSLSTDLLTENLYKNGLRIDQLLSHSIFYEENDYQILILKKSKPITKIHGYSQNKIILKKLRYRIFATLGI
jgi:cyclopropane fatty-acyl-phospholipid synthase-like methyltransferase